MRFIVEHAGTAIESFKGDEIIDLTISLVVKDTFTDATYMTSVKVEGDQFDLADGGE